MSEERRGTMSTAKMISAGLGACAIAATLFAAPAGAEAVQIASEPNIAIGNLSWRDDVMRVGYEIPSWQVPVDGIVTVQANTGGRCTTTASWIGSCNIPFTAADYRKVSSPTITMVLADNGVELGTATAKVNITKPKIYASRAIGVVRRTKVAVVSVEARTNNCGYIYTGFTERPLGELPLRRDYCRLQVRLWAPGTHKPRWSTVGDFTIQYVKGRFKFNKKYFLQTKATNLITSATKTRSVKTTFYYKPPS